MSEVVMGEHALMIIKSDSGISDLSTPGRHSMGIQTTSGGLPSFQLVYQFINPDKSTLCIARSVINHT
jgi:hypothetical protein